MRDALADAIEFWVKHPPALTDIQKPHFYVLIKALKMQESANLELMRAINEVRELLENSQYIPTNHDEAANSLGGYIDQALQTLNAIGEKCS